jgi:HEAT repeat protein
MLPQTIAVVLLMAAAGTSGQSEAADGLQQISYESSAAGVQAAAGDSVLVSRILAVSRLLGAPEQREDAKVQQARSLLPVLLKPPSDAMPAVTELASSIELHLVFPQAVPLLTRLLVSSERMVRRAAASALSDVATASVMRPLARTALEDEDEEVRYFAVLGLARAAGEPGPSLIRFKDKERALIDHWRSWALMHL